MELKQKVRNTISLINNDWVEALQKAEKEEKPIDMAVMFGKYDKHMQDLDNTFMQLENKNKKRWF